jgi:hypothetical protein
MAVIFVNVTRTIWKHHRNSSIHSGYRIVLHHNADPLTQLSIDLRVNRPTNAKLLKTIRPKETSLIP